MRSQLWATLMSVAMIFAGAGSVLAQASVTTDQSDYPPGAIVQITGAGFQAGETVRLQVLNLTDPTDTGVEHNPWEATTDGVGGFFTTWQVTWSEWGAELQLTAQGLSSARVAQTLFTDATIIAASGGGSIPADTAGGSYTSLTGPSITETAVGDISTGTITLTTPPGFVFDTNAPAPYVALTVGDVSNGRNINDLAVGSTVTLTATTTNITFTVTSKSKGQTRNTLEYHNLRVRPSAGSPLASGKLTDTGTATMVGVTLGTNGTSFGTLTEVPGTPTRLVFATSPAGATAGNAFTTQPVAKTQDVYGNNSTVGLATSLAVTIAIKTGTGTLEGTTAYNIGTAYGNGTITGSGLRIDESGSFTLSATASGLTEGVSAAFTVPNANPVAQNKSCTRAPGLSLKIRKSDLLSDASDPNHDGPLLVSSVQNATGGATLSTNGTYVFYLPNSAGNGDTFTYTVSDGKGGTDTKAVTVYLAQQGGAAQQISYSPTGVMITFAGIPGYTYDVQRSTNAGFTSPTVLMTTQAPNAGVFNHTDSNPPNPGPSFYRLMQH
jgi:hypothetical protein